MRLIETAHSCPNSFPKEDKCHTLFKIKLLILFKSLDLDHRKNRSETSKDTGVESHGLNFCHCLRVRIVGNLRRKLYIGV